MKQDCLLLFLNSSLGITNCSGCLIFKKGKTLFAKRIEEPEFVVLPIKIAENAECSCCRRGIEKNPVCNQKRQTLCRPHGFRIEQKHHHIHKIYPAVARWNGKKEVVRKNAIIERGISCYFFLVNFRSYGFWY